MDAIDAALRDVASRPSSLPGQFPWALRRLEDAIHEKNINGVFLLRVAVSMLNIMMFSRVLPSAHSLNSR